MGGGTSQLPSPGRQWPRMLTASRNLILKPSDDSRSVIWADQRAGWWALGHWHRSVTPLPVLRQAGKLNIGAEGIGDRGSCRPCAPALGGREDLDGHYRQVVDVLVPMGATPEIHLSDAVDPPLVVHIQQRGELHSVSDRHVQLLEHVPSNRTLSRERLHH